MQSSRNLVLCKGGPVTAGEIGEILPSMLWLDCGVTLMSLLSPCIDIGATELGFCWSLLNLNTIPHLSNVPSKVIMDGALLEHSYVA